MRRKNTYKDLLYYAKYAMYNNHKSAIQFSDNISEEEFINMLPVFIESYYIENNIVLQSTMINKIVNVAKYHYCLLGHGHKTLKEIAKLDCGVSAQKACGRLIEVVEYHKNTILKIPKRVYEVNELVEILKKSGLQVLKTENNHINIGKTAELVLLEQIEKNYRHLEN